jgi:hypothetical protein
MLPRGRSRLAHGQLDWQTAPLAVQHFQHSINGKIIPLSTDINRQGGLRSKSLFTHTFTFLEDKFEVRAKHLPGRLNVLANQPSRDGEIINTSSCPYTRPFARPSGAGWTRRMGTSLRQGQNTAANIGVPVPDKMAMAADALTMGWTGLRVYYTAPHKQGDGQEGWAASSKPHGSPQTSRAPKLLSHNSPETLKQHAWRLSGEDLRKKTFCGSCGKNFQTLHDKRL